ncbi:prominin isoform X4 [Brachionus plicatilis]|uniref:Prominin isoform X4 n=1 Tax=Brachionus plicatilis TaxID=10195 RepID=A0A3M7QR41_BRAPC|nr:prominin isoform X4 [Brachionus plicatilis]
MFSLNRISFCLLLLAFTSGSASEIQMDNDTLSLISLYNFSSNSLRAGFEPFYLFTNFFIDNLFEPHIPQEIKQAASNSSLTKFADQVLEDYGLKSSWFQDLKFSSIVLPGLVNFIIISMFVSIFVPIVGFCICSYRTCCRGKFSPFDHKFDTYKRKLYSFILFILLIASVIGTVIVFFTGQNTMLAFKNFPKILNSSSGQIDDFSRQEIPRFFSRSNEIIDQINSESIIIFNNTLKKTLENSLDLEPFFEVYTNELSPILNKLHSLYVNLTKKPNNSSNASQQAKELIDTFENIKISMIEKFKILNTIKSENFDQNSLILLMREKSSEIHSNFIQNVNNFVKKIKDEIGDFNNYIEKELAFFSSEINSEQNHEFLKLSVQYYHYFYYVLLGASVFMLSLFILHSLGLAGMCSRRMHNNHKQSCHRGISANFFLAGTAFYFLFAFFLIVLCVIMFVPGITFRQVVCKPTFELEDNHIFQRKYCNIKSNQ